MTKRDLHQEVTDRILASLENGVAPWIRPWKDSGRAPEGQPRNGESKRRYKGINVILCLVTAMEKGFQSQDWFTYNQASKLGGQVRKGERGLTLVYYKKVVKEKENGEDERFFFLKHFVVFNRQQIDGLPEPRNVPEPVVAPGLAAEDARVKELGMLLNHGGDSAHYTPSLDVVTMPRHDDFVDPGAYLSTLYHEAAHWTGHPSRLDRDLSGRFGSPGYAMEELVAEMASAFVCTENGVEGRLQHPEYIAHWIKKLGEDKKFIFRAASAATRAAEWINGSVDVEEGLEEAA